MRDILPLIKVTNALYESIYCVTHLELVGQHRYTESKKNLNAAIEDFIDSFQKENANGNKRPRRT